MLNLATLQSRLIVAAVVLIAIAALSFSAGWAVNGWKKDAACAVKVSELEGRVSELSLALSDQSGKVNTWKAQSDAAFSAQKFAQDTLAAHVKNNKSTVSKVDKITPTTCLNMINSIKDVRK